MSLAAHPLLRFALTVLALLPACFIVWYFLGAFVAAPAVVVVEPLLTIWLPELVESVALQGTDMLVTSTYGEDQGRLMSAAAAGNQLAYPINTRALSYSIPFFTALYFATPGRGGLDRFSWCLLGLWALLALGLLATVCKELMLSLGSLYLDHSLTPSADVTALLYQFSVLMVPALAPVVFWAYSARDSSAFAALLPAALRSSAEGDAPSP